MEEEGVQRKYIGAADFAVFIGVLMLSSLVGIYFGWKDRKNKSTKNYYFGDKQMNPIFIGMSLTVTGMSAVSVVGVPAEVFLIGTVTFWMLPLTVFACCLHMIYIVPVFYKLNLSTVYQILYMAITVYLPALSLTAVTPIPLWGSIVITSVICTFYTTLGGFKAVIWTDVFQAFIMLIGLVAVLVCGVKEIGGFGELFSALQYGERLTFFDFSDYRISSRSEPVAIMIGGSFVYVTNIMFSQASLQRLQACKSVRSAQLGLTSYVLTTMPLSAIAVFMGLIMYTYFGKCDPVFSNQIQKLDQGIPYMAIHLFRDLPGLTGLFIAAIYSGCLSTVSSGINAFSSVILEDFIAKKWGNLKDNVKLLIGKAVAVLIGVLVMVLAFLLSSTEGNIVKLFALIGGVVGGPVVGLFLLGLFFPFASSIGAIIGGVTSFCFMSWVSIGGMFLRASNGPDIKLPPRVTDSCPGNTTFQNTPSYEEVLMFNTTFGYTASPQPNTSDESMSFDQVMYSICFFYHIFLGALTTILIGCIASLITGPNKPSKADPRLFVPLLDNKFFHSKLRKFFRFGVPENINIATIEENAKLELELMNE